MLMDPKLQAPGALPDPLVSAEVDLRHFPYMPLEIERLMRSKTWLAARLKPAIGYYSMNLWCASWHNVPPSSIDNNKSVLCKAAMCDPRVWHFIQEECLRGWVLCSDGKFYHPVVAEIALKAWEKSRKQHGRTRAATEARMRKRREDIERNVGCDLLRNVERNVVRDVEKNLRDVNVTSTKGKEIERTPPSPPKEVVENDGAQPDEDPGWTAFIRAYDPLPKRSLLKARARFEYLAKLHGPDIIAACASAYTTDTERDFRVAPEKFLDEILGNYLDAARKKAELRGRIETMTRGVEQGWGAYAAKLFAHVEPKKAAADFEGTTLELLPDPENGCVIHCLTPTRRMIAERSRIAVEKFLPNPVRFLSKENAT